MIEVTLPIGLFADILKPTAELLAARSIASVNELTIDANAAVVVADIVWMRIDRHF